MSHRDEIDHGQSSPDTDHRRDPLRAADPPRRLWGGIALVVGAVVLLVVVLGLVGSGAPEDAASPDAATGQVAPTAAPDVPAAPAEYDGAAAALPLRVRSCRRSGRKARSATW
ncbi:hypothetical protein [Roseivivax sp. CAU 1753]